MHFKENDSVSVHSLTSLCSNTDETRRETSARDECQRMIIKAEEVRLNVRTSYTHEGIILRNLFLVPVTSSQKIIYISKNVSIRHMRKETYYVVIIIKTFWTS